MRSGLLILACLLSCGCAQTAVVKFWKPAPADVSDLNRIAVVEFSGVQGESVANSLTGQLFEKDFFGNVETHVFEREIDLVNLSVFDDSHIQGLDELLGSARSKGIDGVVLGSVVQYECEDEIPEEADSPRLVGGGLGNSKKRVEIGLLRDVDQRKKPVRKGQVTVAYKLVDSKSGEVRVSDQVTHHFEVLLNSTAQIPTQHEILEQLTQQCLADIISQLTPHEGVAEIELAVPKALTPRRRQILKGNQFAMRGEWEKARDCWQNVVSQDPSNHCALFNLSLYEDYKGDYWKAEEIAVKAINLSNQTCYQEGLEKIRSHRKSTEQTAVQRESQISNTFAETWN